MKNSTKTNKTMKNNANHNVKANNTMKNNTISAICEKAVKDSIKDAERLLNANHDSDFPLKEMVLDNINGWIEVLGGAVPCGEFILIKDFAVCERGVVKYSDLPKERIRDLRDLLTSLALRIAL